MTPREFEEYVCEHFRNKGYKVVITPLTGDYGIDAIAVKGKEKLAIQAKMYRNSRKINRQAVMELHGAKDFADCTKAIIATDGTFLSNAIEVAKKLNIKILYFNDLPKTHRTAFETKNENFDSIWKKYIVPLEGRTLIKSNGKTNVIIKVDWSGIERKTSTGNNGKIKIEIFKLGVNGQKVG